ARYGVRADSATRRARPGARRSCVPGSCVALGFAACAAVLVRATRRALTVPYSPWRVGAVGFEPTILARKRMRSPLRLPFRHAPLKTNGLAICGGAVLVTLLRCLLPNAARAVRWCHRSTGADRSAE